MTDIKLLPLPESLYRIGGTDNDDAWDADQMRDYARDNVTHHTKALREQREFQAALIEELLPYQDEAVASRAEIDALRTRLEDTVRDSTNEIEALRMENKGHGIAIQQLYDRAEALRANKGATYIKYELLHAELAKSKARVERLEEALDTIARVGKASRNQTTRTRWIVARAISALNGDDDWQELPKPKGFHDALLRDQEVGNG